MNDPRALANGWEIPSEGYSDQPYVVVNRDGSWTCVMTTGRGQEGDRGQHVVASLSADQGRTWSPLIDIEPAHGPEASWAMPLLVPSTGRIYAFYTYNQDNLREVKTVDGGVFKRVDSLGTYAYRYSDDQGRTWSAARYEIPMRIFATDRANAYAGNVLFFWGVGKPFVHQCSAYLCASKVGGFGHGFFVQNEGVLFRSPNLLSEPDPAKHAWETLPEGEVGLRTPAGGGHIAGEFYATPMNDGSLYGTYRTIDGFSCHAYSRDQGRTWSAPEYMTYTPGGRRVKNPRAANFVRRLENGKYLYWFHFHGGAVLGRAPDVAGCAGYDGRNPVWPCSGVERDGFLHWSQPEIVLYDENPGTRMSYPDFVEQDGRVFLTETQKTVARVHAVDPNLLEGMWRQGEVRAVARAGLAAAWQSGSTLAMPALPALWRGGSFSLDFWLRLETLAPHQVILDSRDTEGRGLLISTTDRRSIRLAMTGRIAALPGASWAGGLAESAWEADPGTLAPGRWQHIAFVVDGGPKIITVLVDGEICDGGEARQFGWGRFHPHLKEANGAATARVAPDLRGEIRALRLYDRALRTSEAVGNFFAGHS